MDQLNTVKGSRRRRNKSPITEDASQGYVFRHHQTPLDPMERIFLALVGITALLLIFNAEYAKDYTDIRVTEDCKVFAETLTSKVSTTTNNLKSLSYSGIDKEHPDLGEFVITTHLPLSDTYQAEFYLTSNRSQSHKENLRNFDACKGKKQ